MIRKICIALLLTIQMLTIVVAACEAPAEVNLANIKEGKKMLTFDKELVRKLLLEDGYQEKDLEIELASLAKTDARLQPILDTYLTDRTISEDYNVEGLTMKIIMEKYSCNFWNAIGYMEIYLNDPDRAKILIKAPASLYRVGVRR